MNYNILLVFLVTVFTSVSAFAQRPSTLRFNDVLRGEMTRTGNSIMTCDRTRETTAKCNQIESLTGTPTNNNNDTYTRWIDVDGVQDLDGNGTDDTYNSSRGTISAIPATASIEFAGLYWNGNTRNTGTRTNGPLTQADGFVYLGVPGQPYLGVNSDWCSTLGDRFQCYADVTDLVDGNGEYTVANIKANTGRDDYIGGWEILVVYRDDSARLRSVTVYDGHLAYNDTTPRTFVFDGFLTPLVGPITGLATISVNEGDVGSRDDATFQSQTQPTARTLTQDLGNGSISVPGLTRNPAFRNTLGFDIDQFDVSTDMRNADRSAVLTLPTTVGEGNDWYKTDFAVDIHFPNVFVTKTATDLNGGDVTRGDVIRYTVTMRNDATAFDTAINVVVSDTLSPDLVYVPNSLRLTTTVANGPVTGAKTDAAADDVGEFDTASRTLTFRLGSGATNAAGGSLAPGATTSFTFDAVVGPTATGQIFNVAVATYEGQTLAQQFTRPVSTPSDDPTTTQYDETGIDVSDDNDGDGLGDQNDIDDDNDGIPDITEGGGVDPSADDDNDGIPNYSDTNRPGFVDSNNDGVDDRFDADRDGAPNHLDLDSDGDGLFDVLEHGGAARDTNNDGRVDATADTNTNGLDDSVDPAANGTALPGLDTDIDMVANFLDADDDGDTIPTLTERIDVAMFGEGDLDNIPAWLDTDSDDDLVLDVNETIDIDVDNIPDYLDPSTRFITSPADGAFVSDTRPNVTGRVSTGATLLVEFIDDTGTVVATRTVNVNNGNGTWQTQPTTSLPDGAYTARVTATDASGNSAIDQVTFTIDTTDPTLTITTPIEGATVATGTVTGTTEPNASVTVVFDTGTPAEQTVTVVADAAGNWTASPNTALTDGAHTATAIATDRAGNTSNPVSRGFVIQSGTPVVIVTPIDGSSTSDATPPLAGTALANTTVTIVIDAGTADEQTLTVPSNAQGDFFIFLPTLADGQHTVDATADNGEGRPSTDRTTFTVDTTAPDVAIDTPVDGAILGTATPTITGTATPNAVVTVSIDGNVVGTATANASGDWSFAAPSLAQGVHTADASVSDAVGNTASDSVGFTVDTTAPTITIDSPVQGSTTGDVTPTIVGRTEPGATVEVSIDGNVIAMVTADANGRWSTTAPALADGNHVVEATATDAAGNTAAATSSFNVDSSLLFVTIDTPADGAVLNTATPTIEGSATPNAMVEIVVDGTPVATVMADANGDYTHSLVDDLTEGDHILTASVTDGNTTVNAEVTVTIDLTAPVITLDQPIDGSVTNDTTPLISGTTDPGANVTITLPDGARVDVVADGNGAFSFQPTTPFGPGVVTFTATALDPAGNAGMDSATITIDTTSPAIDITYPDDNGYIAQNTITITGSADPGADVTVTLDGVVIGTVTADADGNWSIAAPDVLADGVHRVVAETMDDAGNLATAASDFIVDTRAPGMTITAPTQGQNVPEGTVTITGTTDPGLIVTIVIDGQPVGTATADANGLWTLDVDGLANGTHTVLATTADAAGIPATDEVDFFVGIPLTITTPINGGTTSDTTPTITGTSAPNAVVVITIDGVEVGQTTADDNGDWSFTPTVALSNGEHTVVANDGTSTASTTFTVDPNAGVVTITSPTDGGVTTGLPTLTGTALPGATVEIFIDGVKVGETVADGDGNWTFTPGTPLTDGPHVIEARVPGANAEIDITVDSTPNLAITSPTDGDTTGPNVTVTGTADPGTLITILVDGEVVGTTTANADGNWSFDLTDLATGDHVITARGEDDAGNTTEVSVFVTVNDLDEVLNFEVTGGCSAAGGGTWPTLLVFGWVGLMRRRRS